MQGKEVRRTSKRRHDGGVFRKTTLKNGLRVLTERVPGVRSISLGAWVNVGSRCEDADENGLSHFLEHLVFKGTRHRNARKIAESLESLGGSLNAFTSREHTCYTARILDEHLPQAVDIVADLVCHPTLTQINMDREGNLRRNQGIARRSD
jgi:predicted Zn-dependent peptidase